MRTIFSYFVLLLVFVWCGNMASAFDAPEFHLLLESDSDSGSGSEVILFNFATLQDVGDGHLSSGLFSLLDIPPAFSTGGMTYDGSQFHVLLESDSDSSGGSEVFLASYDSFQDFLDGNASSGSFSQLNISSTFSVHGFTFDGLQYHVLLETDADAAGGSELFLISYDSLQDLLADNASSGIFCTFSITSTFSTGGFDFDGSQYHLLLESDSDSGGGSEVHLSSYDSLQDLIDGIPSMGSFSQLDIDTTYSIGGFFSAPNTTVPDSVTTTRGMFVSGDANSLAASDNLDLVVRRSGTDVQSRTEFEILGTSPTASPSCLKVTLEGAVFARSPVIQTIELWDFSLDDWEVVDSRNATNMVDSTATVAAAGDLSRFVEPTTLTVAARIHFQSTSPRQRFSSNTDQFIWSIGQ